MAASGQARLDISQAEETWPVCEVGEKKALSPARTIGHHRVPLSTDCSLDRKSDAVPVAHVPSAQKFRVVERRGLGAGVEHAVAVGVIGSGPNHFGVDAAPQKLNQRAGSVGGPKESLIEPRAHRGKVMRMGVPLATHVEQRPAAKEPANLRGAKTELMSLSHDQILHRPRVAGRSGFTGVAPLGVVMPVDKPNQRIVDLVEQTPYPIEPEWLESFHRRAPDERSAPVEPRRQGAGDASRHRFVYRSVLLEVDAAADPVIVRLVPDAPIPILDFLAAPLLGAAPDNFGALFGKPPHRSWVVERPAEFGEGEKGCGADIERRLDAGAQRGPIRNWVRRMLVKDEEANDSNVELPELGPQPLPVFPEREVPPAVRFIDAVLKPHRHHGCRAKLYLRDRIGRRRWAVCVSSRHAYTSFWL